MQLINKINIREDFSEYPKLRYIDLSENSAEKFYHEKLNSAFAESIEKNGKLEVNLDNTAGYTSSFLDEAFGNLVYDFSQDIVLEHLDIISKDEPYWKDMILNETFPEWEKRRTQKKDPRKSISHKAWYRLINGIPQQQIWINVQY